MRWLIPRECGQSFVDVSDQIQNAAPAPHGEPWLVEMEVTWRQSDVWLFHTPVTWHPPEVLQTDRQTTDPLVRINRGLLRLQTHHRLSHCLHTTIDFLLVVPNDRSRSAMTRVALGQLETEMPKKKKKKKKFTCHKHNIQYITIMKQLWRAASEALAY